jgi:hypothetical protein
MAVVGSTDSLTVHRYHSRISPLDPELPLPQPNVYALRDAEARRAAGSRRTGQETATANGGDQEGMQDPLGLHP